MQYQSLIYLVVVCSKSPTRTMQYSNERVDSDFHVLQLTKFFIDFLHNTLSKFCNWCIMDHTPLTPEPKNSAN